jgi:hypothetical protein
MLGTRWDFAACAVGSEIFVLGGWSHDLNRIEASVFKYDTVANEWSTLAPMPYDCMSHSASVLDGSMYIVGADENCNEVLRFEPISGVWSTLAPTSFGGDYGTSFAAGKCLYATGRWDSESESTASVASNTWTAIADMLQGRYSCGSVTIGSVGPIEEQDLFDSLIAKA